MTVRHAVLSDLHSNVEALETVLAKIDSVGVDQVVTLGDLVGYNADPNGIVDVVRERGFLSIMGNHDVCACGLREPVDFNPIARDAILWTRRVLSPDNHQFLNVLPDGAPGRGQVPDGPRGGSPTATTTSSTSSMPGRAST